MKSRVRELVEQGDRLFAKRAPLHALWQTMAENFCPIRAEFTTTRALGDEYASHLMTGRPVLAHRDLSNALSAMLRPRGQAWFHARTGDEAINNDAGARQWLDAKADVMRRIIYDPRGQFIRATKQGDHDFTAFGQTVISVDINSAGNGLLYRAWHLRDVAWCENDELVIDVVHHNWKHEARALIRKFPDTVASAVRTASDKEPYREIKCRRVVLPADGLVLADTHCQGLRFGQNFTRMDNLPSVKDGMTVAPGTVHADFDGPMTSLPGEWSTDSRLCLLAASPRPCMVMCAVVDIATNEG